MTTTTSREPGRARWLTAGAVLGAVAVASVLWVSGTLAMTRAWR